MRRLTALLALCLLTVISQVATASAHVFFADTSGKSGIIMHVQPDDDPIAGEPANLFFDIQNSELDTASHSYLLFIRDEGGISDETELIVTGPTSLSARYTFPSRGTYQLILSAVPNAGGQTVTFEYDQSVNRGSMTSIAKRKTHAWAEFGLVASLSGIVVLIVIVCNRRRIIAAFTTWK